MSDQEQSDFKQLKLLIGEGNLKKVIELLHNKIDDNKHLNYLIGQSHRYYDIERAINLNIVEWDNANIEKNRIVKSVLDLIDELEANEKEDQKYLTTEEEKKIEDRAENEVLNPIEVESNNSNYDWQKQGLILRFLKVFNKWYFSPLRIKNWGSEQSGFEALGNYSTKEIRAILEQSIIEGKVKMMLSKKGNRIYKIKQ